MQLLTRVAFVMAGLLIAFMLFMPGKDAGPPAPDPSDKIKVSADFLQFTIDNQSGQRWANCDWTLNGDFEYGADLSNLEAGYPLRAFTDDDGLRFDPVERKVKSLHIHCREPRTLTIYREWE